MRASKRPWPFIIGALFSTVCGSHRVLAQTEMPESLFTLHAEPHKGFSDDSELGLTLTSGNAQSTSFNVKQRTSFRWRKQLVALRFRYLEVSANGTDSARNWAVGGRYERQLADRWGAFVAESVQADPFAGYTQRYASDLGARRTLWSSDKSKGALELGYRYQFENRIGEPRRFSQIVRAFLDTALQWNPHVKSTHTLELMPDVTYAQNWIVTSEIAIQAELTEVLSLKTSYDLRYDNVPATPSAKKLDTTLTTALVAGF